MHAEVSIAVRFINSNLYNKLPRRRVDIFGEHLEKCIKCKCQGHWFPDQPLKDAAYRCFRISGEHADTVMYQAAHESGMDIDEMLACIPRDLTVWIDPAQVSYKIGDKGIVKVIYSENGNEAVSSTITFPMGNEFEQNNVLNPPLIMTSPDVSITPSELNNPLSSSYNQSEPVTPDDCGLMNRYNSFLNNLSASYGQMTLSPAMANVGQQSSPWSTSTSPSSIPFTNSPGTPNQFQSQYLQKSTSTPNFTASTFAQTKFGSTKLKYQGRKQNRFVPSDLSMYTTQKPQIPPNLNTQFSSNMLLPNNLTLTPSQMSSSGFQSLNNSGSGRMLNRSMSLSPSVPHPNMKPPTHQINAGLSPFTIDNSKDLTNLYPNFGLDFTNTVNEMNPSFQITDLKEETALNLSVTEEEFSIGESIKASMNEEPTVTVESINESNAEQNQMKNESSAYSQLLMAN